MRQTKDILGIKYMGTFQPVYVTNDVFPPKFGKQEEEDRDLVRPHDVIKSSEERDFKFY